MTSVESTGAYQFRATESLGYSPATPTSVHFPLIYRTDIIKSASTPIFSLMLNFPQAADSLAAFIRQRTDTLLVKPTCI